MAAQMEVRAGRDAGLDARIMRRLPHSAVASLRLLWRADRRSLVVTLAVQVLGGLAVTAQLLVGREVLDDVLDAAATGGALLDVLPIMALLVGLTAAIAVGDAAAGGMRRLLTEHALRLVQARMLDAAAAVDLERFETAAFHDQLQRAQREGVMAPLRIGMGTVTLVGAVASMVGIVVALGAIQPWLVPLVVVGYLPLWYVTAANSHAMFGFGFGQTHNDRQRTAIQRLLASKQPAAEVRAFGLIGYLRERWDDLACDRIEEAERVVAGNIRRSTLGGLASSLFSAGVLVLVAWLLLSGRMGVAGAATAALAIQQLGGHLRAFANGAGELVESSLFLDDTLAFFEAAAAEGTAGGDRPPAPPGFDHLLATGITFTYPDSDRSALDGIDIEIGAGEVVALVGENGSGKTTLAKILSGLYRPTAGTVTWDGVDLSGCDPRTVHEHVAVTFQDFVRYPFTAAENIGVGRVERMADRDAVAAAATHAGADEVVAALGDGLDTLLAKEFEGGDDLSVGQWQRMAIARAFFRDAPFVVLDEPTAALDPRAEAQLFERIRQLFRGRSVLLISHRFSSVRSADRIYVLHEGRVVEHGTHEELMALGGRYEELFTLQAQAYLADSRDDRGTSTGPDPDGTGAGLDGSTGGARPKIRLAGPWTSLEELPPEIRAKLPPDAEVELAGPGDALPGS